MRGVHQIINNNTKNWLTTFSPFLKIKNEEKLIGMQQIK